MKENKLKQIKSERGPMNWEEIKTHQRNVTKQQEISAKERKRAIAEKYADQELNFQPSKWFERMEEEERAKR